MLFTLLYGKSKKRMKPIMVDTLKKCKNYWDARAHCPGWHAIVPADSDADTWRQKSATIGGNRCQSVGRVGHGPSGYIGKNGFNQHT
jgi:hypothetical protein